jgi:hypothetical protein
VSQDHPSIIVAGRRAGWEARVSAIHRHTEDRDHAAQKREWATDRCKEEIEIEIYKYISTI